MLNPKKLEADLLTMVEQMQAETDPKTSPKAWAKKLATVVHAYTAQGQLVVPAGALQLIVTLPAGPMPATNTAPITLSLT